MFVEKIINKIQAKFSLSVAEIQLLIIYLLQYSILSIILDYARYQIIAYYPKRGISADYHFLDLPVFSFIIGLFIAWSIYKRKNKYKIALYLEIIGLIFFFLPDNIYFLIFGILFFFTGVGMMMYFVIYEYLLRQSGDSKGFLKIFLLIVVSWSQYLASNIYWILKNYPHIYLFIMILIFIGLTYKHIQNKISIETPLVTGTINNKFKSSIYIIFLYLFAGHWFYKTAKFSFVLLRLNHRDYHFDILIWINLAIGIVLLFLIYKNRIKISFFFYSLFASQITFVVLYSLISLLHISYNFYYLVILYLLFRLMFYFLFGLLFYILSKNLSSGVFSFLLALTIALFILGKPLPADYIYYEYIYAQIMISFLISVLLFFIIKRDIKRIS